MCFNANRKNKILAKIFDYSNQKSDYDDEESQFCSVARNFLLHELYTKNGMLSLNNIYSIVITIFKVQYNILKGFDRKHDMLVLTISYSTTAVYFRVYLLNEEGCTAVLNTHRAILGTKEHQIESVALIL